MMWLSISILCFLWIVVWVIIHAKLFAESIRYRCAVRGAPLWTIFVPIVVCAITLALFINQYIK